MRPAIGIALVALHAATACQGDPLPDVPDTCDLAQAGTYRCKDNAYEKCEPMKGDRCYWLPRQVCILPQECRIDDAGGHVRVVPSCYEPDANCPGEGLSICDRMGIPSPALWTCSRRPSDQALRWSVTRCDEQSPPAICLPDWLGLVQDPPREGCYEVAVPCPLEPEFPYPVATCDGDVRLQCLPTVVDGKAVFLVDALDCAADRRVCRIVGSAAGCLAPP